MTLRMLGARTGIAVRVAKAMPLRFYALRRPNVAFSLSDYCTRLASLKATCKVIAI
jgi:hypothetical protein